PRKTLDFQGFPHFPQSFPQLKAFPQVLVVEKILARLFRQNNQKSTFCKVKNSLFGFFRAFSLKKRDRSGLLQKPFKKSRAGAGIFKKIL
ncbi:MAG: hypothetical protein IIV11_04815, partial [Clostridia bacterium]|nr:hypothetical protein [Clostridia bacterium]